MITTTLNEKVNALPRVPGVYLYKDSKGKVIYVGKAKNLRNRVKSYFIDNLETWSKTKSLVSHIHDIDYIEVLSELEALILEAELIKKYRPKYNISLKDDKSYIYIIIRNEKINFSGKKLSVPKIVTARKPDTLGSDVSAVFGPYPESQTAKYILRTVRKIFPFRDCSFTKFNRYSKLKKPCLYGYIGLCQAPCTENITLKQYKREILRVKELLAGKGHLLTDSLKREMNASSKNQEYEKAAEYRDILNKLEYIRQHQTNAQEYLENPYLVDDIISASLNELVKNVPILKKIPNRIECYDISNVSGKEAVGSMVVAINGRIQNREYKRFKIRLKDKPDDFEMMREMLRRRLKRKHAPKGKTNAIAKTVGEKKWESPDLIVVDGGKGQVSAALNVLKELDLNIKVIGLAKRFETIVYFGNNNFTEINLDRQNEGLKLLQRLRDEAHQFAQKYHHFLRLKKLAV